MKKFIKYHIVFIVVLLYVIFGALLFSCLENPQERERWQKVVELYQNMSNSSTLGMIDLEKIVILNIKPNEIEYLKANHSTNYRMWDFYGSLFFSLVVISTIGYGNQVPSTSGGQIACILYAMLGIPLFLTCLQIWIRYVENSFKNLENHLPNKLKKWHTSVSFTIVAILFVFVFVLPAIFIANRENWNYKTSLYFAFITISTIGFGDYVPTNQLDQPEHYKIFIMIWILFGLSYSALLVAWFQVIIEKIFAFFEKNKITVFLTSA